MNAATRTMVVWTLNSWPKARYLARALGIPLEAFEFPYLFVPIGGPELSVFEAMEKPELGGLTSRLLALTKPLAAAAYEDNWVRRAVIGESKLAVAFHPGVSVAQIREMSERDGYRTLSMDQAMSERGTLEPTTDFAGEGLDDWHLERRTSWRDEGCDDDAMLDRTLALPCWSTAHHSAIHYLASQPARWPAIFERAGDHPEPSRALAHLIVDEVEHPHLLRQFIKSVGAASTVLGEPLMQRADQLSRLKR